MIGLAITTSTERGGIALFDIASGKVTAQKSWTTLAGKSDVCVSEIARLLKKVKTTTKDISEILLDVGPGSFTGCRISASVTKTLAQANNIPIHTITSVQLLAYQAPEALVLIDAHKSLYYSWNDKALSVELLDLSKIQSKLSFQKEQLVRACTHLEIVARDHNKIEIAAREGVIAKAMATTSNNEIDFIAIPQQIFQMSTRPKLAGVFSPKLLDSLDGVKISKKLSDQFPLVSTMVELFFVHKSHFKTLDWPVVEPLYVRVPDAVEKMRKN